MNVVALLLSEDYPIWNFFHTLHGKAVVINILRVFQFDVMICF